VSEVCSFPDLLALLFPQDLIPSQTKGKNVQSHLLFLSVGATAT